MKLEDRRLRIVASSLANARISRRRRRRRCAGSKASGEDSIVSHPEKERSRSFGRVPREPRRVKKEEKERGGRGGHVARAKGRGGVPGSKDAGRGTRRCGEGSKEGRKGREKEGERKGKKAPSSEWMRYAP